MAEGKYINKAVNDQEAMFHDRKALWNFLNSEHYFAAGCDLSGSMVIFFGRGSIVHKESFYKENGEGFIKNTFKVRNKDPAVVQDMVQKLDDYYRSQGLDYEGVLLWDSV